MNPWRQELDDFVRALSGAFLFGTPLLFTMEMWELGATEEPWKLLLFLLVALVASAGLAYSTGFRHGSEPVTLRESLVQAVDAVAVGIVASVAVLAALNQLRPGELLSAGIGKVAVQTVPLALGASVANAVFARGGRRGESDGKPPPGPPVGPWRATLIDVGATIIGGVFVCVSIVPTDEIPMLASAMTYWHEVGLVALSLAVTYAIVFASGFDPEGDARPSGVFQHPSSETAMAYLVSLGVSLGALMLFDRVALGDPLGIAVSQTLVLAFPAAVGGAAGRLVV